MVGFDQQDEVGHHPLKVAARVRIPLGLLTAISPDQLSSERSFIAGRR